MTDVQLFTFEYRESDESRAHSYCSSFRNVNAARTSARAFKKRRSDSPVATRIVELVREGTGRVAKPIPGEHGEWK